MLQLYIEYDGQKIDFQANGCVVKDGFFPETASPGAQSVTDRFDLLIIQSTTAALEEWIRSIERGFDYARKHRNGAQAAYLYFAMTEADDEWRARINDGQVFYDSTLTRRWREKKVSLGIIVERAPYWDGPEAPVPLSNGNGTDLTDGIDVYNCNDGQYWGITLYKAHNYVEIAEDVIQGDLPAPVRIEMTNQHDSINRLNNLWISHNVYANPADLNPILEGEDAAYARGGVVTDSGTYSGGHSQSATWTGDTQQIIMRWELSQELLTACAGQYFKILGRLSVAAGVRLQIKITFPQGVALSVVDAGAEITTSALGIQELGIVQIPPWLPGEADLAPVDLTLYARKVGGGAVGIDFLQLSPLDGYRILTPRGYGAAYTIRIVDDGINENIWTDGWTPSGKTGHYIGMGSQIKLMPENAQRLYFLQMGNTGDTLIDRLLSIKMAYRPRRRGL